MAEPPLKPAIQKSQGYIYPANPGHPVAIPIQQPPRKQVYPPPFHPKTERHRGRGCCCYCCCIFWILIFVVIFAVVIATALIYFIYEPKPPVFRLQSFRVSKLNITEKPERVYLDADTAVLVEVKNPNRKMRFNFGETSVDVSVDEGEVGLGSTRVAAFTVKEKEETRLKAETRVRGEVVDDGQGKNVKGRFERKEVVPRVDVRTRIGVNLQGWKMANMEINVVCGGVSWQNIEGGLEPKCTFTFLKWIKIHS